MSEERPGYSDTPMLPDSQYCVHDPERPHPPAVQAGGDPGAGPTSPPADATVLLEGAELDAWEHLDGRSPEWTGSDDSIEVAPSTGDIQTVDGIGDCQLHVEWAAPEAVSGHGQGRGNSGVFLLGRYEVQVLDCHENPTYADGYAGAVYGQHPPTVNACRPPGEWQSYDIVWRGPRFEDGTVTRPARITLFHNGVLVQENTELIGPTTHQDVEPYEPHPPEGPLRLQDHGDRVRFRNIWYRPIGEA